MSLASPVFVLLDWEERLPRSLAWVLWPFVLIAAMILEAWELRGVILRIASLMLLAGLLDALFMKQVLNTGDIAMLLLPCLTAWHLYQTKSMRARIQRLENDLGKLKQLQRRRKAAA
jgi:hypothetical protein